VNLTSTVTGLAAREARCGWRDPILPRIEIE
jgi:hypothetical protein